MVSEPDTGRRASEDAEPRGGWIVRAHIDWRGEQVSVRTLGPEVGWIVRSHVSWRGDEGLFIRVLKPLSSRRILKTLREKSKGKVQRGQYLLTVGLSCYSHCDGGLHSLVIKRFYDYYYYLETWWLDLQRDNRQHKLQKWISLFSVQAHHKIHLQSFIAGLMQQLHTTTIQSIYMYMIRNQAFIHRDKRMHKAYKKKKKSRPTKLGRHQKNYKKKGL